MFFQYFTLTNKNQNNYSILFDFSNLNQIILSFWFDRIQHYSFICGETCQIIHFNLLSFTIQITFFWVVLICFKKQKSKIWFSLKKILKSRIGPSLVTSSPNKVVETHSTLKMDEWILLNLVTFEIH